jgi:hypothetical protein
MLKRTAETIAAVEASGETPLDFLLRHMRGNPDGSGPDLTTRLDCAKAAAPYVHAKLAAVDATLQANVDGSVTFTWLPADDDQGNGEGAPANPE